MVMSHHPGLATTAMPERSGCAGENATDFGSTQEVVMEDSEVVAELRARLAERIGQQRYELWFSRQTDFRLQEGSLTVVAANTFTPRLAAAELCRGASGGLRGGDGWRGSRRV